MVRAVCPGTFDPVTLGHLDILGRAARLFDEVVVAVGTNAAKQRLFDAEERIAMLRDACSDLPNVRVESFAGLLVAFCRQQDAQVVVKGLRSAADLDFELPMAHMNAHLSGVETVYLPARADQTFVSSSLVKEVAALGGDVSSFLSPSVHLRLLERLEQRRRSP